MPDKENGNIFWRDGICCELDQIFSYKSFCELGVGGDPGFRYKKIKVRFLFDVKEPEELVYSSVATF